MSIAEEQNIYGNPKLSDAQKAAAAQVFPSKSQPSEGSNIQVFNPADRYSDSKLDIAKIAEGSKDIRRPNEKFREKTDATAR